MMIRFSMASFGILAADAGVWGTNGSADCPCVPPETMLDFGNVSLVFGGVLYDATYGHQGCRPYDLTYTPACSSGEDAPSWCAGMWCYVGEDCRRPKADSVLQVVTASEPESAVSLDAQYSYATCGYLDKFALGLNAQTLRDRAALGPLRVSFPGDESFTRERPPFKRGICPIHCPAHHSTCY